MLGFDNPIHILFLLVVLLMVFGAKRLPEMGRSLGTGMRGFRDSLTGTPTQAGVIETGSSVTAQAAPTQAVPDAEGASYGDNGARGA